MRIERGENDVIASAVDRKGGDDDTAVALDRGGEVFGLGLGVDLVQTSKLCLTSARKTASAKVVRRTSETA